jgi:hypothetical protein
VEARKTCALARVFALQGGADLACRMDGKNGEATSAIVGCILLPWVLAGTNGARHFR